MNEHDEMPRVARFWNRVAGEFDSIYTGKKSPLGRMLDRWLRKDMYQRFAWVMEKAGDASGLTVCDVGCGSGRFVNELARRGATVTGIDVAPEMLKLARRLTTEQGTADRCRFIETDVLEWTPDQVFDMVIAIGFWDYIADPRSRLRVIRSMTGSRFLSAWPRYWTWRTPVRKVRLGLQGCPVYFYRRPQIERYFRETGFEPVSWQTFGKLYCVEARPV